MALTENAKKCLQKMFPNENPALAKTDPDFVERFDNFAFDEVPNSCDLDDKTRFLAILAALMGCQGLDEFRSMLKAALNLGLTPIQCKEIVYQGVPYLGIGRVMPFINALNEELLKRNIKLPLPSQQTTTMEDRYEKGMQAIGDIVGEDMKKRLQSGPAELANLNRWLGANCFGDYYTRTGLDYRQREMLTFCFLAGQGGCEPQLLAHCQANMRLGNDRAFLIKVMSQLVPFLGYPRCLNALRCIDEAAKSN